MLIAEWYGIQERETPQTFLNSVIHPSMSSRFRPYCIGETCQIEPAVSDLPEYEGTLIWVLAVPSPPSLYARTSIM